MNCAVVVAVLPEYREHFIRLLRQSADDSRVDFFAGQEHLVETVKSGSLEALDVTPLRNRGLLGRRLLWQHGALAAARGRHTVVTDLNPRSLSAWMILLVGRVRRQRVLVWGHVLPRKGAAARTVPLRRFMRRLASGVISYTWRDSQIVRVEDPRMPLWVAANGLYPSEWLGAPDEPVPRTRLLYVGRLVAEKKPALLLEGYSAFLSGGDESAPRLVIVGDGPERAGLIELAHRLGIDSHVDFLGHVSEFEILRSLYAESIASVSPGYAGLSLTQSLGFGVPMIVADAEPHAPEIELLTEATGVTFSSDSAESLAAAIRSVLDNRDVWASRRSEMVAKVREAYSADAMARGFAAAIGSIEQATREVDHA